MLLSSSEWKAEAAPLLKYLLRVRQTARYHIRYLLINCETTVNLIIITIHVTFLNITKSWVLSMQLMSVYFVIFSNQNTVNCCHKSLFFLKPKYFLTNVINPFLHIFWETEYLFCITRVALCTTAHVLSKMSAIEGDCFICGCT